MLEDKSLACLVFFSELEFLFEFALSPFSDMDLVDAHGVWQRGGILPQALTRIRKSHIVPHAALADRKSKISSVWVASLRSRGRVAHSKITRETDKEHRAREDGAVLHSRASATPDSTTTPSCASCKRVSLAEQPLLTQLTSCTEGTPDPLCETRAS